MRGSVNLLPSTKQEKLKASRLRQVVISVGSIILLAAVALPVVLFVSKSAQGVVLKRTQSQIDERKQKVASTPDIFTMLTVQNNLNSLPPLYKQRLLVSDLFKILPNVLSTDIRLTSLKVGTDGSIEFTGTSSSYAAVNKFYVALQRAGTQHDPEKVADPSLKGQFNDLVLSNVSGISGGQVTFSIKGRYSQSILANDAENQSSTNESDTSENNGGGNGQ